MYRDLSDFFVKALWAHRGWAFEPRTVPEYVWPVCCTNGRCNNCK